MEYIYMIVGLYYFYSIGHLVSLQPKAYKKRTQYEKFVTWFAFVATILIVVSLSK